MTSYVIPTEMRVRHIAVLGTNGSGKTAAAKSQIVEPVLAEGGRVIVIDPTGVWWGLRLKADGKPSAFKPYIFGGDHGDMPLRAIDAAPLAEAFGKSSDSAVFDTSLMTVSDRSRFFTEFANTIFRANKGPLHLVIDECHLFMPQAGASIGGLVPSMLHAGNNLVSLGRSRGLRITMITQRPAKLHKDSLTQAQSLIAMRVIAPQDRKAVVEWLAEYDAGDQGKEVLGSLSGFKAGEAWVWAPLLGTLEHVRFPLPKTFDSSAAPESGDVTLFNPQPLDLGALRTSLSALAAHAEANDPTKLKTEIAALKAAASAGSKGDVNRAYKDGYDTGTMHGYSKGEGDGRKIGRIEGYSEGVNYVNGKVRSFASGLHDSDFVASPAPSPSIIVPQKAPKLIIPNPLVVAKHGTLTGPQRRILNAVNFWHGLGHQKPTRSQVALVAGYSATSTSFTNPLSALKTVSEITYPEPGTVMALANTQDEPLQRHEAVEKIRGVLGGPERKILDAALVGSGSRECIAGRAGYSHTSTSFTNPLSKLKTLGLITYPSSGMVAVTDWARELFNV